jgi:pyruvate/2-oxoacid:ferredoxin oxidoreductase alpha subunit
MTASSGPGISLMMEGVSYLAGAELPAVIVNIQRAGPGLGNIFPEQGDYNQVVKGGGHGNYRCVVLAPNSVQEMCEFTMRAFDLADKYRGPVFVLSDGYVGQIMESFTFPEPVPAAPLPDWALTPDPATNGNVITSIYLDVDTQERFNLSLQEKYARIASCEARCEQTRTEDSDIVLIGFGIVSRILQSAVEMARAEGIRVGLFRPQTLWPFPGAELAKLAARARNLLVVELNNGQMVDDVRLCVREKCPVHFLSRLGGAVPDADEVVAKIREIL